MAYQAVKHKRVIEELELVDENGIVKHTLVVDLDVDTMAKQLSEKHLALVNAQQEVANINLNGGNAENTLKIIGEVVIDMFQAVFGMENYNIIIEFYENKTVEMCQEVLPFVLDVVIPKIRTGAQESKMQTVDRYRQKKKRFGFIK